MVYSESELNKLHNVELQILDEIIRICEKNNINYFLVGGSALGAVRHGGFIPWDDDIDVALFRDDYDFFFECCKTQLNKAFFLQHYLTEKNYNNYFIKIRKKGTLFETQADLNLKINKGVFVDVFPLDVLPPHHKLYMSKISFYYQLFLSKTTLFVSRGHNYFLKKLIRLFLRAITFFIPKKYLFEKLDRVRKFYRGSDGEYVYGDGVCVKRSCYASKREILFEGRKVYVPGDTVAYLSTLYGIDYMELPPLDRRINHKPVRLSFNQEDRETGE